MNTSVPSVRMRVPMAIRVVLRLVRHEVRLLHSLVLWIARRRQGAALGELFPSARGSGALMFGLGFVCVVETVMLSMLLAPWPTVHLVMLVVDVYTVFFVIGLYAASVVRPHVLESDAVRVRYAGHVDLRIPLERIAGARRELMLTHPKAEGVLNIAVAGQTSVTIELAEPLTYPPLFGRAREVRTVRVNADAPAAFVRAVNDAVTRARGDSPYAGAGPER
ncbi:hypothetical protein ACIQNG_32325 [Streptomyces sp. NPDC091377]|uniref:hypothetical protein n=1 Tax=Streptomyces sp. NPDC091377 TaxID=3365995 RepID=UPI00380D5923